MNICTIITRSFKCQFDIDCPWGASEAASYHSTLPAAIRASKGKSNARIYRRDPFFGEVHSFDGNPWTEEKLTTV